MSNHSVSPTRAASTTRPPVGSLFVTPDGDAYRLRDYGVDWSAEPFTGEETIPSYAVQRASGGNSTSRTLPEDAALIWSPDAAAAAAAAGQDR